VTEAVEQLVTHRVEKGIAWITLNRPDARNALTPAMRDRITALVEAADADLGVRCVVLSGVGKGFCTGADLRGQRPAADRPEGAPERAVGDVARMIKVGWQRLIGAILDCSKPVIAGVNGTAAGGGVHLALACDLVVAAEDARFIEVFVRRGIAPDAGGAYLVTRLVGPQKAKELFFFGDDLAAPDAQRLGLVNKVVPADQLEAAVTAWAERLAASPTKAVGYTKWLVNRALESDRRTAFDDEAHAQELIQGTADAREGMRSFVERRDPDFRGW
jgi:2-(1,2-epoxy-1,2-dihydrophenyl)acetyl-CoA isomerase